ncbi:unnamed protein product [Caenorhabditis sp. 36 PRJEB53466]|nr:unnamed protein product [Caenorhabditis sp. 36 PRJEB53466]
MDDVMRFVHRLDQWFYRDISAVLMVVKSAQLAFSKWLQKSPDRTENCWKVSDRKLLESRHVEERWLLFSKWLETAQKIKLDLENDKDRSSERDDEEENPLEMAGVHLEVESDDDPDAARHSAPPPSASSSSFSNAQFCLPRMNLAPLVSRSNSEDLPTPPNSAVAAPSRASALSANDVVVMESPRDAPAVPDAQRLDLAVPPPRLEPTTPSPSENSDEEPMPTGPNTARYASDAPGPSSSYSTALPTSEPAATAP